jgi:hypothetical protein
MQKNAGTRWVALLTLAPLVIASTACHRVIIDSGLEPAPEVHHQEWTMAHASAIYPAMVDASTYCGGNWARVETKQSFLNGVVEAFTFGIISPMDVKVVCAAVAADDEEASDATEPEETGPQPSPSR